MVYDLAMLKAFLPLKAEIYYLCRYERTRYKQSYYTPPAATASVAYGI